MLDIRVVNPDSPSDRYLLWLHPAGGNMRTEELARVLPSTTLVIPNGPYKLGGSETARVWYNQVAGDLVVDRESYVSLVEMELLYRKLLERFPNKRPVLAGFSNGGSMASTCAVFLSPCFPNVVNFSGYVPRTKRYEDVVNNPDNPIRLQLREHPTNLWVYHAHNDNVNYYDDTLRGVKDLEEVEGIDVLLESHYSGHMPIASGVQRIQKLCGESL